MKIMHYSQWESNLQASRLQTAQSLVLTLHHHDLIYTNLIHMFIRNNMDQFKTEAITLRVVRNQFFLLQVICQSALNSYIQTAFSTIIYRIKKLDVRTRRCRVDRDELWRTNDTAAQLWPAWCQFENGQNISIHIFYILNKPRHGAVVAFYCNATAMSLVPTREN